MGDVRHLYVHLPFCSHRCGYCDFVTVVGRDSEHEAYVDAVLAELALERALLAPSLETVYLGGGTPTLLAEAALDRLLRSLPRAAELTVEANPETVTPGLADMLARAGVTRISLGAQSFAPHLLATLERRATPAVVRAAVSTLRAAGHGDLSLDLIYGIPGQTSEELERDLAAALALEPDHLSCYELEAKPGTRFAHRHGGELERQAEAMEGHFALVVDRLQEAGFRWYETANFCRPGHESRHNLAYWLGRDYLGLGIGAVSTVEGLRWSNRPALGAYLEALGAGERPARVREPLAEGVRRRERLMLGLRLDRPLHLASVEGAVDAAGLERLERLGLLARSGDAIVLTPRGRLVGGGATVELLADDLETPANRA